MKRLTWGSELAVGRSLWKTISSELLQAALVLSLLLLVYLWQPLTQGGYYAPTDILQEWRLFEVGLEGYTIQNSLMRDVNAIMHPFYQWNAEQLGQGRLPSWNPYNGWGAPHLANYESAIFSPYSLPFYLLDFRTALLVAAFLKLFVIGLMSYLFFKSTGLQHLAALAGGIAFMFSGYILVWQNWLVAETCSSIPAALYCSELALQARPTARASRWLALLGLSISLTVGLLAGHPETFFYGVLIWGAYVLFRVISRSPSWRARGYRLLEFSTAGMLALGLAAVQLIPFFEYLFNSYVLVARDKGHALSALPLKFLPVQAFPNLFGNPSWPYYDPQLKAWNTNYNEINSPYLGLAALFLAGLALLTWRRHREPRVIFFGIATVFWLCYVYNIAGLTALLKNVPLMGVSLVNRSHLIGLVSLTYLSAFGLDYLLKPTGAHSRASQPGARLVLGWGSILLAGALAGAALLLRRTAQEPLSQSGSELALSTLRPHLLLICGSFLVVVLSSAVVVMPRVRYRIGLRQVERLAALAIIGMIFLQSGFLFRNYNPVIKDEYFWPKTPLLTRVMEYTRDDLALYVGATAIQSNTNLWHKLRTPGIYDAIYIKYFFILYRELLNYEPPDFSSNAKPDSLQDLQVLGIRYVVTSDHYPFTTPAYDWTLDHKRPHKLAMQPDKPVVQTFRATADTLSRLVLPIGKLDPQALCTLKLELSEQETGRQIASELVPCAMILSKHYQLGFEPQPSSLGRRYKLQLTLSNAEPDKGLELYLTPEGLPGETLYAPEPRSDAMLNVMPLAGAVHGLELVWNNSQAAVYQVPDSAPRYYSPEQARGIASDEEALSIMQAPGFRPLENVLIHGLELPDHATTGSEQASVEILTEQPDAIELRVTRRSPGWLVTLQSFYPGWRATVNGQPVELSRANLAFTALPIGEGTSEILLEYAPASIRIGLIISLVSLQLLCGSALVCAPHAQKLTLDKPSEV